MISSLQVSSQSDARLCTLIIERVHFFERETCRARVTVVPLENIESLVLDKQVRGTSNVLNEPLVPSMELPLHPQPLVRLQSMVISK